MTTSPQPTSRKVLSVLGLLALIIVVAWLAISFVRVMPGAFGSLASLADSVYHPERQQQNLTVSAHSNIVNVNEDIVINWNQLDTAGDYTLNYQCNDEGVALNVVLRDNNTVALDCETPFTIDTDTITLTAESNKKRFVDIVYSVTFTPEDERQEIVAETKRLTIVNPNISTSGGTSTSEEEPDTTVDTEPDTQPDTGNTDPTPEPTTTVREVIYALPQSDPNGNIDLQIRHVGVGELVNNSFIPRGQITAGDQGAFRFAVKNIGTKTTGNWSYEATLPDGSTYKSGTQAALRPNEEAVITLGFTTPQETGNLTIGAKVTATGDIRSSNNRYNWVMTIVK